MKTYAELKAQLNLCYELSIHFDIQNDDFNKIDFKKYIANKIEILLNEIKTLRDSQIIFKEVKD